MGRKIGASERIEPEEEIKLTETGEIGIETPRALQFTLFYHFCKGFGLRGRQDHRNMMFGDINIKSTADGTEYVELSERNSKTMDGSKRNDHRVVTPKIFSNGKQDHTDVVHVFRLFSAHRPESMNKIDSPFYLTPVPERRFSINKQTWYYPTPMGINTLGSLMKSACERSGIIGKKTNHSLRKSTVTELSAAGVPPHKIIKITGHKQSSSIQHYDNSLSVEEHKNISSILCRSRNVNDSNKTTTTTTTIAHSTHPIMHSILTDKSSEQQNEASHDNINTTNPDTISSHQQEADLVSVSAYTSDDELALWAEDIERNYDSSMKRKQRTKPANALKELFVNSSFHNCTFNINF